MESLRIYDIEQVPSSAALEKFRINPPDKCLLLGNSYCGVWWKNTPGVNDNVALVGQFYAENHKEGQNLIEAASEYLKSEGCGSVVAPMDGNTWKPYRFVTWSDGSSPFLMEPQNPKEWPLLLLDAGFSPYHEYVSTRVSNLTQTDSRLTEAKERLQHLGITWRTINTEKFADELRLVYQLSLDAFKDNILYTPIDEKTFLKQYLPVAGHVISDYVLIAQDYDGSCCGFVFAIPDLTQPQYGESIDRLIIKTLAVSPKRRSGGLGAILVREVQKKALQNGLNSSIHALMYNKNNSANIGKNSTLIRRYTLFNKNLI